MTEVTSEQSKLLIEQYKLYVEMMDRTSARRADANRFFVTLLTTLLALIALAVEKGLFASIQNVVLLVFAGLGLALCWIWYLSIRSYRQLNDGKCEVIHQMEKSLPFQCYEVEWDLLGRGKDPKLYQPISHVEERVPLFLAIPYLLLLVYALWPAVACLLQARP